MTETAITIAFQMVACREAVEHGLRHVEQQVNALESAVASNPGYAFDLAKALVESACKTILTERSITFDVTEDLPALFRLTHQALPMLPVTASSDGSARVSLLKTLNGLHTALQGVCELRSQFGFTSHGSPPGRSTLERTQALLAAQAADAIVGFLYRVHIGDRGRHSNAVLEYQQNPSLNSAIDDLNSVVEIRALSEDTLEYQPSEVLFYTDMAAYRGALALFLEAQELDKARLELIRLIAMLAREREADE